MNDMLNRVRAYYENAFSQFGPTPKGVDWNSLNAQEDRFAQLSRILENQSPKMSVLDFGCGYGAMLPYLRKHAWAGEYIGYDISELMIAEAKKMHLSDTNARFISQGPIPAADLVIASGLFNVMQVDQMEDWVKYIKATIFHFSEKAQHGICFNLLTSYSEPDKMRSGLYYADPLYWFDFCKRSISPHVALLHDYPLWEFTLLIRKQVTPLVTA